jgi:glycosyltransferase involved in cell wall biosynthesis
LAGVTLPDNRVVVFFAGVLAPNKPFRRIVEAFARVQDKGFLLAFCGGGAEQLREAIACARHLLPAGTWAVSAAVPRADILASSWEADIGIVDYSPSLEATTNQLHCAPTKLYEYMAAGLAIVGSDNPSLRKVVVQERVGECAAGGSSSDLGEALRRVVAGPLAEMKQRSERLFAGKYSYEKLCAPVVASLARRIQGFP